MDLGYALSVAARVFKDTTTSYLFNHLGMRRTDSEEALTLTLSPYIINLTEAINALDTALFVCSSSCAKSKETDEAEASPTAPMDRLVLNQASVGDKTDQSTVKVVASGTPEKMEHEVVPTGAK